MSWHAKFLYAFQSLFFLLQTTRCCKQHSPRITRLCEIVAKMQIHYADMTWIHRLRSQKKVTNFCRRRDEMRDAQNESPNEKRNGVGGAWSSLTTAAATVNYAYRMSRKKKEYPINLLAIFSPLQRHQSKIGVRCGELWGLENHHQIKNTSKLVIFFFVFCLISRSARPGACVCADNVFICDLQFASAE